MPYHFQYVPPSGPLSGRALEEQTQRAFNELGADMDAFEKSAAEALDVAANARSTANEALGTANRAISEAQDVNGIAQEAKNESGAALATAQEARNAVNAAVDAASDAAALAETAQATAEEAKSTADAAQAEGQNAAAKAAEAQRLAQAAMIVQSGDFIIDPSSVNANELISNAKIYAATEIINTPATAPAFLEVMSNSDETSVTQAVWSENTPQQYLRTGTTVWGVNAGQSDFALQALPDDSEAAPVEGTLSVSNNGTAMSAAFIPGNFTASEADALALYGELRFTLGAGFRGAVLCNDMEIARVAELDLDEDGTTVEAIIVNAEMYSEQTEIAALAAAWETDALVLRIRAAWQDRSPATTWGEWVSGGGGGGSPVPRGIICMWSGEESDTPYGWALCDGNNGTPDLRNRFILGVGGSVTPGLTGGANTHTHTATASSVAAATTIGSTAAVTTIGSTAATTTIGATTLTEAQIPSHGHKLFCLSRKTTAGDSAFTLDATFAAALQETTSKSGLVLNTGGGSSHTHTAVGTAHTHTATGTAHTHTATGTAHTHTLTVAAGSNLPPYYALAYIMKL